MAEGIDHSTHLKSLADQQLALSNEIEKKKWKALCGAAPFLAIITSLKLNFYTYLIHHLNIHDKKL